MVGSSSEAHADPAAIDRLEPAERGSRFFAADSLEMATPDGPRLTTGVVGTYAHRLRTFGNAAEGEQSLLVRDAFVLHPGAALVLAPGARFALDMPLAFQLGEPTTLARAPYDEPASPALGDLRAGVDVRFFGPQAPSDDGLTLAAGVNAWLPTGSRADYTSDGYARVGAHAASALRAKWLVAALRVGYMYRRELAPFGDVSLGSEARAVLGVGAQIGPVVVGPELFGSTILRDTFRRKSTPLEALLGAHVTHGELAAGAALGTSLVSGFGSAHLRALASIEWTPGAATVHDRDRDGVPDADDVCPDAAGTDDSPSARGCPAAPGDADHDGVLDVDDACPDLAGVATKDPMTNGCPDADGDTIPDPIDACPKVAGEASTLPRFHGCPRDTDGDDVPDTEDACASTPGVRTDDPRTNGCPRPPSDRDKDGAVDEVDACPDEPGPRSDVPSADGCPVVRRDGKRLVLAGVAVDSEEGLAAVAAWLGDHPEVTKLTVVAHDAKGRALKRALAIVTKLAAHGVAWNRLAPRGALAPAAATDPAARATDLLLAP